MNEFGALFISGYMITSILLLPLMGLYLALSLKEVSLVAIIRLHKTLILFSIVLPVSMVMISYGTNSGRDLSKRSGSSLVVVLDESTAASSDIIEKNASRFEYVKTNQLPALQDVVFYFVDLLMLFSILGLLSFLLRYVLQAWRLGRIMQNSPVSKLASNCSLIESPLINTPFSVGILRKNIFIPKGVSDFDRKIIIQHELNHFSCHHHAWSLLEAVLACAFWFNPIMYVLRRRGAFLRELECDGRTIRKFNRYEYTRLLVKTAESTAVDKGAFKFSLLTQGWARKGVLRKRIETLLRREDLQTKTAISAVIAAGAVITAAIAMCYGNLNDLQKEAILSRINQEYTERAPSSGRIDIGDVPQHFINALLVQEDTEFFEHKGIRLTSIFRAMGRNLKSFLSGGPLYKDGGSTITQQLAKQFINDPKKTMKRKFEELKIARVLERDFTKKEILEMYLNMIYFGNDAFGLRAASDTYFGHDYKSLTLFESAMLVPFITAPSKYNVLKDPITAEKRQKFLLERIEVVAQNS